MTFLLFLDERRQNRIFKSIRNRTRYDVHMMKKQFIREGDQSVDGVILYIQDFIADCSQSSNSKEIRTSSDSTQPPEFGGHLA
jgi:hypothetical protein